MVQLKQDPKKSTIMCVLLVVLVVIVVRLGFTSAGAAKARAGQSNPAAVASTGEGDAPSEAAPGKGIKLTRPVVPGQPRITRNIFKLNASLYPSGGPRSSARLTEKDDDAQDDEQKLHRLASISTRAGSTIRPSASSASDTVIASRGHTMAQVLQPQHFS